jgi:hypothetical protein
MQQRQQWTAGAAALSMQSRMHQRMQQVLLLLLLPSQELTGLVAQVLLRCSTAEGALPHLQQQQQQCQK